VQDLVRAELHDAAGKSTYTTNGTAPATKAATSALRDALAGTVVSVLTRGVNGSPLLSTYVPLTTESGDVAGIVRLDQDYRAIESSARQYSLLVAGVFVFLLAVLFLVFVPVLAHVTSRVRDHLRELEYNATHDELTGLPNRLAFRAAAAELVASSRAGALAIIDIDGFTDIAETLGERGGDTILREAAVRLRYELDDVALLTRLGDDEFGVLLSDTGAQGVDELAEHVERALSTPVLVDDVRVALTATIGAALIEHGADFELLLRRASSALSLAKRPGQPSTRVCGPEVDLRDVSSLAMAAELRDALRNGDLLVHFQPQSDLTTRRIRGVEALLRWEHPRDGLLTANRFINYVERSGLSRMARQLVLERSIAQWREWHGHGIDLELSINLSSVDMLDVSLPEDVETLLHRYGVPADRLILEITERTLVADERRARAVIERLIALGVRIAIDDFGTGYSSLASLLSFPIRQVKLDRSLLAGVPGDPRAEAVIGGCVEIAHGIGATVVAEGIETSEQWRFASLMGCDIAQGYLVGRPGRADGLTALLKAPNRIPLTIVA